MTWQFRDRPACGDVPEAESNLLNPCDPSIGSRLAFGLVQDQFIFGTSYPCSSMAEPIEQTLRFSLSRTAMEKYPWGNGARLLM